MKSNFKTKLLLGAAVTALSFGAAHGVQAADFTLSAPTTWGAGDTNGAAAEDNVNINGEDLTVNESDNTQIGAITDTNADPDGNVAFDANAGGGAGLTITVGSIDIGSGNVTVQSTEGTGGDADPVTVTVTGGIDTTGTLTVAGGTNNAGDNAVLNVGGNISAGSIVVDDDGGNASATLVLNGTGTQNIAGVISADGDVTVSNSGGTVTFTGDNTNTGTWLVNDDGNGQAVVLTGDNAGTIELGDNDAGTADEITLTLSGTNQDISGGITGGASEATTVVVSGTVNQSAGAWTADTVSVTGTLEMNANITADVISGSGTLDVDTNSSFIGQGTSTNLTVSNVTVADGVTLTVNADTNNADGTISSAVLLEDDGNDNGGGGTLSIDASGQVVAVSGAVTTARASEGAIAITDGDAATTNFTADIGTSSAALATFGIADAGGNSAVSTTGNLYVDAITIGEADVLTFAKTSGSQVVSGTITSGTDTDSGIVVGNGTTQAPTVTFNGAITTIDDLTVNDGAKAIFNEDATFADVFSGDAATVKVAADKTLTANTQNDADVTTWEIGVNKVGGGAQTVGNVAFANDAVNLAVDTVNFVVTANSAPLTVGASVLQDVFQGDAQNTIAGATVTDNSYIYGFTLVDDTNNVDVTVAVDNDPTQFGGTNDRNVAGVLFTDLAASTNADVNRAQSNLAAAGSEEAVSDVLESVTPTVDAGAVVGATGFTTQTSNITSTQLASLRNGTEASGMYAGNVTNGLRGWVQGFGLTGDQDDRDGVSGYDVDSYGVAVGLDTQSLADNWIWGLAFAYSDTDVDSDGVNNTNTDIDNYQVSVYANYDLDDRTYISGQAGYVWGDNDQTRYNVGGTGGSTATADYDSDVIFAGLEAGRKYMVGGNTVLTPKALINYQHYDADGYTENGAGGLNLTTSGDELDLFEIGVGVDASWDYQQADGSYLQPKIGVGVRHDLVGDEYQTTSTFAAGGSSFETEGFDPAQTTFNVSADVTYFSTTNWELSAGYDFEVKSDYDSHAGTLKAAYKF